MILALSEHDVAAALSMADGVRLVERAFEDHAEGRTTILPRVSLPVPERAGAFRIMAASVTGASEFGLKTLTGYPGRRSPGETYFTILLFSADCGALRAVIAGKHLTGIRTGAASGVAAKYLARPDAAVIGLFGAGLQARYQIAALAVVRPISEIKVYDVDGAKAAAFAAELGREFGIAARSVDTARDAVASCDLVVTATTASEPVLDGNWLEPGTHVSGVGANAPAKCELDDAAFQRSTIVVDFREQVLQEAGDVRRAVKSGAITESSIHTELGGVVTGRAPGRTSRDEITLFKSVGVAVEDVATAAFVYQRAVTCGLGSRLELDDQRTPSLAAAV